MKDIDRIHAEGLSKTYIAGRFTAGLSVSSSEPARDNARPLKLVETTLLTSEQVNAELQKRYPSVLRPLIRVAYKYKERIRRIPLLGRLALQMKNRAIGNVAYIECLTVSDLLGLDVNDFVVQGYRRLLGRAPESEAFTTYQRAICAGMPREAFLYLLAASDEFSMIHPNEELAEMRAYQKCFRRYQFKNRLKKMPLIGWIYSAIASVACLQLLATEIRVNDANRRQIDTNNIKHVIDTVDTIQAEALASKAILNRTIVELTQRIEAMEAELENRTATLAAEFRDMIQHTMRPSVFGYPGGVTVVQARDYMLALPSEEWRLAAYLSLNGTFSTGVELFFRSLLRPGMMVLDIGANLGTYTIFAAKAGCAVCAYEPTPATFDLLNQNIKLNGLADNSMVETFQLALGDQDAEITFYTKPGCGELNSIYDFHEEMTAISVPIARLDTVFSVDQPIDIVKIDVEGAEPLVIRGMKRVLAFNPKVQIIVEFSSDYLNRAGSDPVVFLAELRAMDFEVWDIAASDGALTRAENNATLCDGHVHNLYLTRFRHEETRA